MPRYSRSPSPRPRHDDRRDRTGDKNPSRHDKRSSRYDDREEDGRKRRRSRSREKDDSLRWRRDRSRSRSPGDRKDKKYAVSLQYFSAFSLIDTSKGVNETNPRNEKPERQRRNE